MLMERAERRELASITDDYVNFGGLTGAGHILHNPDPILRNESQGYFQSLKLYDQIYLDTMGNAAIEKAIQAVIGCPYKVLPGVRKGGVRSKDTRMAELVAEQLRALGTFDYPLYNEWEAQGFDSVSLGLMEALVKGCAFGEAMWASYGDETVLAEVRIRDQDRFRWFIGDKGLELRLWNLINNTIDGTPIPPRKMIAHRFGHSPSNPHGRGAGQGMFYPAYFRRQLLTFILTYADRSASPITIGEYGDGDESGKEVLLDALKNIRAGTDTVIKQGTIIRYLEAMQGGNIDVCRDTYKMIGAEMVIHVLGESGSTDQSTGGGSLARDQVGDSTRLQLSQFRRDMLDDTQTRSMSKWIAFYNDRDAAVPLIARVQPEDESNIIALGRARADRDAVIGSLGYTPRQEYINQTYGDGWDKADNELIVPRVPLPTPDEMLNFESSTAADLPTLG